MSYDLLLRPGQGAEALSSDAFPDYFACRTQYELNEAQAWYENLGTEVYFS